MMDNEIIQQNDVEDGYSILDEMVGFYESNRTDASVHHDEIIYKLICD